MQIKQNQIKISKREAVSTIKKTASMLARFHFPEVEKFNQELVPSQRIITPMMLLNQITLGFEYSLKSKYRKECLEALNSEIEKKWNGVSRILSYG
ncbi:hypothetical protein Arnit_0618 [Arcobacter nitrofigilis DSM 7299]|uniref:Uncharacterized protein n=1 Tax=Arcobacter nitrofigilis (strain ATCC 33309 / DSM 7299 / CCUG 15893 / LMG 7604 / NCTC 12251 / CI) TaxID=572480 RepID=D5V250_ARCNC|nr:hypothetical protein [Arcobacter nitrofigilis]ADG92283.1 hypothetical protein Arnit_0618 [Arcobacter nitrofigilis DSM 7299]